MLDIVQLVFLELDDLRSVTLFHLELGLAQGLVFFSLGVILLLEESNLLCEHLDLACRLCGLLGNFLVLRLADPLQGLDLLL